MKLNLKLIQLILVLVPLDGAILLTAFQGKITGLCIVLILVAAVITKLNFGTNSTKES